MLEIKENPGLNPSAKLLKNKKSQISTSTMGKSFLSQYFLNNKKGICLNIKVLKIVTHRIAVLVGMFDGLSVAP